MSRSKSTQLNVADESIPLWRTAVFNPNTIGQILPNKNGWTSETLDWFDTSLQDTPRKLTTSSDWNFLQGNKTVQGKLLGGCVEVLEFLKGTAYWITPDEWGNSIMFLETSEEMMNPSNFKYMLRNYAAQGILHTINGLIVGRPFDNKFTKEYNEILLQIVRDENQLTALPIITEMDFGHTSPTFTIPFGLVAEINCEQRIFSILDNGVTD